MCEKRKEKGMIERKVVLTVWWHRKDEKKTFHMKGMEKGMVRSTLGVTPPKVKTRRKKGKRRKEEGRKRDGSQMRKRGKGGDQKV